MAGIAIPVILHLWNNKQGKVLRIGSIALLEKGSRRQARSRKLSEWWLLLLRCWLLLLLALLLSGPFWRDTATGIKTKGWILGVKKDLSGQAYKPLIDSLLKAGYERHEWGDDELSGRSGTGKEDVGAGKFGVSAKADVLSYWDLFRSADRAAPAGIPFYVFTSGRRSGFTGKRPVSDRIVHWFTDTTSTEAASHWVGRAWLCSPDSIRVLTGSSRPTGTSYSLQVLPVRPVTKQSVHGGNTEGKDRPVGQGDYHIGLTNGHLSVALDSQPPVIVDTTALRVSIYIDNTYTNDSRYLVSAFHALQQFTRQNIQVTVGGSHSDRTSDTKQGWESNEASRPDWLFWLSALPVPSDLRVPNIVRYEPGREIPVDTWMQGMPQVAVSRRVDRDSVSGTGILWKDGFGGPLLSLETSSGKRIFHFFSHFDPAWNGLVWSPRFPVLLQDLLDNPASFAGAGLRGIALAENPRFASGAGHDLRVLDPEQVAPQKILTGNSPEETTGLADGSGHSPGGAPSEAAATDLAPVCWILIFLLFVAERILSFRSPKIKTDG